MYLKLWFFATCSLSSLRDIEMSIAALYHLAVLVMDDIYLDSSSLSLSRLDDYDMKRFLVFVLGLIGFQIVRDEYLIYVIIKSIFSRHLCKVIAVEQKDHLLSLGLNLVFLCPTRADRKNCHVIKSSRDVSLSASSTKSLHLCTSTIPTIQHDIDW